MTLALPNSDRITLKQHYMQHYLKLARTAEKIISYLDDYMEQNANANMEDVYPIMRTMQNIFPKWVLHSCSFKHPNSLFITDNCKDVLGYPPEYFTGSNGGKQTYFACIHEDDIEYVQNCFSYIENFLKESSPADYKKLRFIFQYRLRHFDGYYITVHDEKATLELSGSSTFFYCILKDVSKEVVFSGVKLEIYRQDLSLEKLAEFRPAKEQLRLSKRENELVALIQRGFTTKEIAGQLNISQYTARNIRQKMFEKYKVNNAIELLNKTMHYN